jgi:hypothetical protein
MSLCHVYRFVRSALFIFNSAIYWMDAFHHLTILLQEVIGILQLIVRTAVFGTMTLLTSQSFVLYKRYITTKQKCYITEQIK